MCGRFNIIDDPLTRNLLEMLGIGTRLHTHYNIAPTENIPVILERSGTREIHTMRWWLTPSWAPDLSTRFSMFNARCERLEQSKAFRHPLHQQRGLVPASGFIEWKNEKGGKQPWYIKGVDRAMAFAAIWDIWQKHDNYVESVALITTEAPEPFRHIHNRFPVLLTPDEMSLWLNPSTPVTALKDLFIPEFKYELELYPLSKEINNAKVKDDRAIKPTGAICRMHPARKAQS